MADETGTVRLNLFTDMAAAGRSGAAGAGGRGARTASGVLVMAGSQAVRCPS
jgi:hypothetical protein